MNWRLYFVGVKVEIDEGLKDSETILREVHKDLSDYLNTSDNSDYAKLPSFSFLKKHMQKEINEGMELDHLFSAYQTFKKLGNFA